MRFSTICLTLALCLPGPLPTFSTPKGKCCLLQCSPSSFFSSHSGISPFHSFSSCNSAPSTFTSYFNFRAEFSAISCRQPFLISPPSQKWVNLSPLRITKFFHLLFFEERICFLHLLELLAFVQPDNTYLSCSPFLTNPTLFRGATLKAKAPLCLDSFVVKMGHVTLF